MLAWYALVWLCVPLADAPVVDSWIYAAATRQFAATGQIHFAGVTEAMPVSQVLYASAWTRLFGPSFVTLDLSVVLLGAIGGMCFYALARRCGAMHLPAIFATALLIANPCYLFLSFSFMTDIPFLATVIAAWLLFAAGRDRAALRWACGALAFIAFMVRPFAAAVIAGCAGATILFDAREMPAAQPLRAAMKLLAPLAVALALCALGWIWLTVLMPEPWMLALAERHFGSLTQVPLAHYVREGVLYPLLYLGIVLSPLAIPAAFVAGRYAAVELGLAILLAVAILATLEGGAPMAPDLTCFGGWANMLVLRPQQASLWHGNRQWIGAALGSLGAAGLILAGWQVVRRANRATAAVLLSTAVYWCAIPPMWLFNDRYYLPLLPAGCLLMALVPMPERRSVRVAAFGVFAALAVVSLAGVYEQQRGLQAVLTATEELKREGIPRSQIDAGYPLNGEDLYPTGADVPDAVDYALRVPMVTTLSLAEYTIADGAVPGTVAIRGIKWPGFLGIGDRELYILRKLDTAQPGTGQAH